jgi:hypothetical protein
LLASTVGDITIGVTATATEVGGSAATTTSQNLSFSILSGMGTDGFDRINGDSNANTIPGSSANAILAGGAGADTFKWSLNDNGTTVTPGIDKITDFATANFTSGGDRLDLRDLLVGETNTVLDKFLHFNWDGTNTTLYISTSGAFSAGNATATTLPNVLNNDVQQIVFNGVNLTTGFTTDLQLINDLISKGKLITD